MTRREWKITISLAAAIVALWVVLVVISAVLSERLVGARPETPITNQMGAQ